MKKYFSTTQKDQKGFTLVELMVSLALFIIVVLALIGSLYTVNDASRKVQAMRTVMDNLNFAMESISRTVRTSERIVCNVPGGPNCPVTGLLGPGDEISMNSTLGEPQEVHFKWERNGPGTGRILKETFGLDSHGDHTGEDTEWQSITSPEIDIEKMEFYVDGADRTDNKTPSVIVRLDGLASVPNGTPIPFSIQTYLSQRTPE